MARVPSGAAPEQLVAAFEQGFNTLWRRTHVTLGDVTLFAVVDRVLRNASDQFPLLAALQMEDGIGVQFSELRRRVKPEDGEQLRQGMRSTLVQFLTVTGNLTAEVLTSALHGELAKVGLEDLAAGRDRPAQRSPATQNRESGGAER